MNGNPENHLTPKQAADVIRYFHDGENQEARRNGRRDISLGLSAIHAASGNHSILPDETPMLTLDEMGEGMRYIDNPPKLSNPGKPSHPSDFPAGSPEYKTYAKKLDALVDKGPFTYDEARRILEDDE